MIENKKIHIYTQIKTLKNKLTCKVKLEIDFEETDFESERGIKYKESLEYFLQEFYEYFNYHIFKEHSYYGETLDEIVMDLELETIQTRQDFMRVKNRFIDAYGFCDYYSEDYRDLVLDMIHDSDFKGKRFWAKHYRNLPLDDMDRLLEDFFNNNFRGTLFSQNFVNLVKYDEYIIFKEKELNRWKEDLYEGRIKFISKKEKKDIEKQKEKIINKKTYILKDKNTGYYKIGKSSNPLDREKTLQSEKPTYELIKIFNNDIETKLHKKYKKQNVRGEWFDLSKIQLKYICTNYK